MKLAPIKNPHAQTSKVEKKTKTEEKDELIEKTKQQVLDKYSVSYLPVFISIAQEDREKSSCYS
jgi:hypothetical protein